MCECAPRPASIFSLCAHVGTLKSLDKIASGELKLMEHTALQTEDDDEKGLNMLAHNEDADRLRPLGCHREGADDDDDDDDDDD